MDTLAFIAVLGLLMAGRLYLDAIDVEDFDH